MTEQILSQEEIDALLVSMDKGEIDLEADEKDEIEVKPYDLTSQGIMLRDQFYALEEVYDRFAESLQKIMSSLLQRPIEVQSVSKEMAKFGDFLKAFSSPTSFNIFNMDPLIGSSILVIEPELVFYLIDCMFGGEGKNSFAVREFTVIEKGMIKKFASQTLKCFEKAWENIYPVKISLKEKSETKPKFVHVMAPNDLIVAVGFSISGDGFSGNIYICMSYLMLDPIKDKLSSNYLRDVGSESTWESQLTALLKKTSVELVVELGTNSRMTIGDLLKLSVGEIVRLDSGPQDVVTANVEGVPKYEAFPGIIKGSRAIQIKNALRQNGGNT